MGGHQNIRRRPCATLIACGVAILLVCSLSGVALSDPHQVYEEKCDRCHEPHAREFADKHLVLRAGQVFGAKNNRELGTFLRKGHGRMDAADIPLVVELLTEVLLSGGVYADKCVMCHEPAVTFVRLNLISTDDGIIGRYSGYDIAAFMRHHGRLDTEEQNTILRMMARQLRTQDNRTK